MFFVPSKPGENRGERLGELESRSPAREFSQTLPRFSTGYGGTVNMFYFFYKIIIFIKGKTIYKARTVNSRNSEKVKQHCSRHFRAS